MADAMEANARASKARSDASQAEQSLAEAKKNVEEKQTAAENIIGTPAEVAAADATLAAAKKEQSEAEERAKEAQEKEKETQNDAEKKLDAAESKAKEAENKRPQGDSIDGNDPFKSAACDKAFGIDGDRVTKERLGADWTDWRSRLKRPGRPSPNEETPYDALNMPVCGLDDTTNQTAATECKSVVLCPEGSVPDHNCGCKGSTPSITKLIQSFAARACAGTRCEGSSTIKATLRGFVCDCSSGEQEEQERRTGGPNPIVLDTMMGTLQPMADRPHATSVHVVRSLFDGKPHDPKSTIP